MSSPARVTNQDKADPNVKTQREDVKTQREANKESGPTKDKITQENIERFLYGCNLVVFLVSLGVCVASITITSLRKSAPWGLPLWQWMLLITSLLIGPLLSKLLQEIFRFLVEKLFWEITLWDKSIIIYYMVELVKTTCMILWFGIILLAWIWVMDEPRYLGTPPQRKTTFNHNFLKTFAKIRTTLVTLIIGAFLWLLKDIMLLKAKYSFQMDRFKERVWESVLHQRLLNILTQKLRRDDRKCMNKSRCGELNMPPIYISSDLSKDKVSSWWINDAIKWFNGNPKVTYFSYDDLDDVEKNIQRRSCLSFNSKRIIENIKTPKNVDEAVKDIHKAKQQLLEDDDWQQYYNHVVECLKATGLLSTTELNDLVDLHATEKKHKESVEKIYRHRDTTYKALQANKSLFETLNRLIDVLLLIVIITLWLILLNLVSLEVLGLVGGAIAGSAFLIGDTAKNILNSLLFIFSVHPFDIGDWCLIEDTLVEIKDIRVLFTSTSTFDGEERYYSNTALVSQNITNYTRSHCMNDHLVFYPNIYKAEDIVKAIESELEKLNKPKGKYTDCFFLKEFLEDQEKLKITLHFKHNLSSHEIFERTKKKSELISKINDIIILDEKTDCCMMKKQNQNNAKEQPKTGQAVQQSNEVSNDISPSK